jgi:hypothetical protein
MLVVRVAINVHFELQISFRLILYYPFSCNLVVVRVAINVHFELQILSASAWYYTTPPVINVHSELQILSAFTRYILPRQSSIATRQRFELQSTYTPSYKYWMLPSNTLLTHPFSCNRIVVRVANTKCFCLILYYPFSYNWTVVWVAIDVHFELQILSFRISPREWWHKLQLKCLPCCNLSACWVAIKVLWIVAIEVLVVLQLERCRVTIRLIKL